MIMNMFDFIKRDLSLVLVALFVIGVAVCFICFLVDDEPAEAATVLSEPLTENNEPTTEEVTTEVETTEEETTLLARRLAYFDVPLDMVLQDHIFDICDYYNVDPSLVVAMIQKESNFKPDEIGDGGASYGLMQIQPYWHEERIEQLGGYDLLDPYQNVRVGIDILAELFSKSDNVTWVLMAYNGGESYATEMINNDRISEYARLVLFYQSELKYKYFGE